MKRPLFIHLAKISHSPSLRLHTSGSFKLHTKGFSLVEMIGVLAIIAILLALISPQVINQIKKGNAVGLAQSIPVYGKAVEDYYRDIGSLLPLNVAGVPTLETTGNSALPTSLPARLVLDASDPLNTGAAQWFDFVGHIFSDLIQQVLQPWAPLCLCLSRQLFLLEML